MQNAATQRVVVLVDMDCFYCQVETRLNPSLKGKPVAVVQYNQWKGGGIIAVNYEARDRGVTRYMRGNEAKEKCPEIILVSVPTIRGKADLSNYRDAGDEVALIFSEYSDCVQRASIDEAYLDLTKAVQECMQSQEGDIKAEELPNTFVLGYCDSESKNEDKRYEGLNEWLKAVNQKTVADSDYLLAVAGKIIEKMRLEILIRTGFHCSAGIAHNKILAKLCAGLHKPKKQTILPQDSVPELYETLPIFKVKSLGGKFGKQVSESLSINYMSELYKFSLQELQQKFDSKTSFWLFNIARGIDLEPVMSRLQPESIGCCKNFSGNSKLTTKSKVEYWLRELATEISERLMKDLEKNKRRAKLLTVSFYQESATTRCGPLNSYKISRIVNDSLELLKKFNATPNEDAWNPPIKYLGLSASKFTEELTSLDKYLKNYKNLENKVKPKPFCNSNNLPEKSLNRKTKQISNTFLDKYFKTIENISINEEPEKGKDELKSSFFFNFLNKKNEQIEDHQEEVKVEDEKIWFSLSEMFPDVNAAEANVVEILSEPRQKKVKKICSKTENLNKKKKDFREESKNDIEKNIEAAETCDKCGKNITLDKILEHWDYHAALKLSSEINGANSGISIIKNQSQELESQNKRKKKVITSSKKIKNITSFFNVTSKE